MAVFEQRRRAHRQRPVDHIKQRKEVLDQPLGQARGQEVGEYLVVGQVAQGHRVEIVVRHKLVEDVGAQHHGARYRDGGAAEVVADGILLDD